jgi:hypothetical protein
VSTSRLDHESRARRPTTPAGAAEPRIGRSIFLRQAARQWGFLAASLVGGFAVGVDESEKEGIELAARGFDQPAVAARRPEPPSLARPSRPRRCNALQTDI